MLIVHMRINSAERRDASSATKVRMETKEGLRGNAQNGALNG